MLLPTPSAVENRPCLTLRRPGIRPDLPRTAVKMEKVTRVTKAVRVTGIEIVGSEEALNLNRHGHRVH